MSRFRYFGLIKSAVGFFRSQHYFINLMFSYSLIHLKFGKNLAKFIILNPIWRLRISQMKKVYIPGPN